MTRAQPTPPLPSRRVGAHLRWALALFLLTLAGAAAALHPKEFRSAEEEARYRELARELRCVMCQNQSLADSPAGVADDLRHQLLAQIREGRSDAEIKDWFVDRYGEFILYRPRVEPTTWLLWFGPFVLLAAGAGVIVAVLRRQRAAAPARPEPEEGQEW
ncbi:MAG: cytochrome c-type biogenesis protein CcmH [Lysobacteraceae bacterium]|jgi:cytochrome c-type biogenesis protein CcmH|nr:cytochrome c-type biogenesis protein CcmH [Xanthomonadaceae bacterium]MCZ8317582.1 cytochrome c-type biogenesis protein CcmH [Silanimonas sp.]